MSETPEMVLRVMRASFDHWRANADRLGAHMDKGRTIDDMTESEFRFAESHARVVIEAMRDAPEPVISAGRIIRDDHGVSEWTDKYAQRHWDAMIDSALGK